MIISRFIFAWCPMNLSNKPVNFNSRLKNTDQNNVNMDHVQFGSALTS